jgi:hypothetical protein
VSVLNNLTGTEFGFWNLWNQNRQGTELGMEPGGNRRVSSKWEENRNQTEVFLKIRSSFLFKVTLGHPSILEFLFSFRFIPASLDFFIKRANSKLARFIFSSVQAHQRSLGGFFKHQSSRRIFFFSVVCSRFEENSSIITWEEYLGRKLVIKKSPL